VGKRESLIRNKRFFPSRIHSSVIPIPNILEREREREIGEGVINSNLKTFPVRDDEDNEQWIQFCSKIHWPDDGGMKTALT